MKRIGMGVAVALISLAGTIGLAGAQTKRAAGGVQAGTAASMVRGPQDGEGLFKARCGYCHLAGGTGTMMLERRLGKDKALLAERTDLDADYVKAVARHGLNSMPTITRVEVTDAELNRIAAFLADPEKGKGR